MSDVSRKPIAAKICGRLRPIRIEHPWGNGDWHHPADRPDLEAVCRVMNVRHGDGTHVVIDREPDR